MTVEGPAGFEWNVSCPTLLTAWDMFSRALFLKYAPKAVGYYNSCCLMPLGCVYEQCVSVQVLKQLTNSNKAASSLADVEDQLAALAAAAPEWITIETDLVGKKIVRLQRKVNNKQIRLRLMGMSGSRRASGAGLL